MPEEFSHREDIDKRAAEALDPLIAKQEELNQKEQKYLAMPGIVADSSEQLRFTPVPLVRTPFKISVISLAVFSEYTCLLLPGFSTITVPLASVILSIQVGLRKTPLFSKVA